MKFIIVILMMQLSMLFPSSLELYGTGERSSGFNAMEIGLGDTYFFSDHKNKFSGTSIASLWRSDLTRLSFSSNFYSNIDGYNNKDINMSFFSFSFPVLKNKTILFGLAPYTRSDIKLIEESGDIIGQSISDFIDSPLSARSEYRFLGGISNLYAVFSSKINKNSSFGLKFNSLFGNQLKTNKIVISTLNPSFSNIDDTYNFEYLEQDSTSQIILNQFSGFSIQFDLSADFDRHNFGMSFTMMGPININIKKYYDLYEISDPYDRYFLQDYSFLYLNSGDDLLTYDPDFSKEVKDDIDFKSFPSDMLNRINDLFFGYQYNLDDRGIIFELHYKDLFENFSLNQQDINILNNKQPKSNSYHLGFYKRYENSRSSFFNSINLRLGGYYKNYSFIDEDGTDMALTFGLGVTLNDYSHLVDLGIKFGRISTPSFEEENYLKGSLSISIGEKWFKRSRR